MYKEGRGVARDPEMARTLFTRAAEAGYPWGKYHLGNLAFSEESYATAKRWFEAAASDDVLPAIFHLGVMHQLGLGVPANEEVACSYYERASRRGHVLARRNIMGIMLKRERSPWKRLKWHWKLFRNALRGAWIMARNRYDARLGMQ
jgi:TPR repeat protein